MPIRLADLELHSADPSKFDCSAFDCGDDDLNEFVREDCTKHATIHLSQTKLAYYQGQLVAFVALLTDAILLEESERTWLLHKNITFKHIPALKVGRLAVQSAWKKQDIGTALIKYAVGVAFRINATPGIGCRFVTLDAYPDSVGFYEKIGFQKSMHKTYKNHDFPSMHYDIVAGPSINA